VRVCVTLDLVLRLTVTVSVTVRNYY